MKMSATKSHSGTVAMRGSVARNSVVLGVVTVGVFTFGLIVGGIAIPARAHTELVSSTPASDTTITELPEFFSVTTSEPLLDLAQDASGFGLQVIDSSGKFFGDGCLDVSQSTLSMGSSLGNQGEYRFVWQVVAEDGHPVSGEFTFAWEPDPGTLMVAGSDEPPVCGDGKTVPSPNPTETATPITAPSGAENTGFGTGLWIAVGVLAALLAATLVTSALLRRRRRQA